MKLTEKIDLETSLRAQINDLKEEINEYKQEHELLMLAQAAFVFEQAVCSHVLPKEYPPGSITGSLRDVFDHVNGRSSM